MAPSAGRELTIRNRRIADDEPAWVCAEIGCNHGGSIDTAGLLIRIAAEAGFDAVKLQKRDIRTFLTPEEYAQPYDSEHAFGRTYGEHREALELDWDSYVELRDYAHNLGLAFGATGFDVPSVEFLADLGVDFMKMASGSILAHEIPEAVRYRGISALVMSTGGVHDLDEIRDAYGLAWPVPTAILQCTSLYPCPAERLNLLVVNLYREQFPGTVIGFSDHEDGIGMAPVAFALGARIFEKHTTYSHTAKGSDHAMSLEPEGQRRYVQALRNTPLALGTGVKVRYPEEIPAAIKQGRRDLVGNEIAIDAALTGEGRIVGG